MWICCKMARKATPDSCAKRVERQGCPPAATATPGKIIRTVEKRIDKQEDLKQFAQVLPEDEKEGPVPPGFEIGVGAGETKKGLRSTRLSSAIAANSRCPRKRTRCTWSTSTATA